MKCWYVLCTLVLSSNRKTKLTLACTHDSNCFSRWYAFDKGFLPKAHFTFSPSIIFVINFETGFTSFWVVVSWPAFAMRRLNVNDTWVVWSSMSLETLINFTALFYIILHTYFIFHHKSKKYYRKGNKERNINSIPQGSMQVERPKLVFFPSYHIYTV